MADKVVSGGRDRTVKMYVGFILATVSILTELVDGNINLTA